MYGVNRGNDKKEEATQGEVSRAASSSGETRGDAAAIYALLGRNLNYLFSINHKRFEETAKLTAKCLTEFCCLIPGATTKQINLCPFVLRPCAYCGVAFGEYSCNGNAAGIEGMFVRTSNVQSTFLKSRKERRPRVVVISAMNPRNRNAD